MAALAKWHFSSNYGEYAEGFKYVGTAGDPSFAVSGFIVLFLISLLSSLFTFSKSIPADGLDKPRNTMQEIFYWSTLGLLTLAGGSLCYYWYSYVFNYLPQYVEWFGTLPESAVAELGLISVVSSLSKSAR